jgi:hypothetical protein
MLTKKYILRPVLDKSEQIFKTFYEILNFNLVILTIFLKEIWPLLKLHMAKFGLILIFLNLATLTWGSRYRAMN